MARKPKDPGAADEPGGAYYYAGGKKVELTPAEDLLAVDERRLAGAGEVEGLVKQSARQRAGGMVLVERKDLGAKAAEVVDALRRAGALQPVYRAQGAILIALPEVRVEESRAAKQGSLEEWLRSNEASATVASRGEGTLVIAAASGYGGDALGIANALSEQVGPEMAQPRFLRVTERPSAMRG
jgi:hypothetical protein